MRQHLFAGLSLALTLTAGAAGATTYASRADFDAAFPTALHEDFNGYAVGPLSNLFGVPPLVKVTSSSNPSTGYVYKYEFPFVTDFYRALGSASAIGGPYQGGAVQLEFTHDVFGVAFDDLDLIGPTVDYARVDIGLANGLTGTFLISDPDHDFNTAAFFGYSSAVAIRTLSVASFGLGSDTPYANLIDNLSVSLTPPPDGGGKENDGPPGAVPEPGAWALMIMGFGLAGAAMRRRGRASYLV